MIFCYTIKFGSFNVQFTDIFQKPIKRTSMNGQKEEQSATFIAMMTITLIAISCYVFLPFLMYIIVGASLALATSHGFNAALKGFDSLPLPGRIKSVKRILVSVVFTSLFLIVIFMPLIYFITVTFNQVARLDIQKVKDTITSIWIKLLEIIDRVPYLQSLYDRLKTEGTSLISGDHIEALIRGGENMISGASGLILQIIWILFFYFLFNLYGQKILHFIATLMPTGKRQEQYLYIECTGTVAVVFYGTLFNMAAQGIAFGLLMTFIGNYDSFYLGALAGFCSIVPIIGSAIVYIPVVCLEILAGNYINAVIILIFAWACMGFVIDNILRMIFIGYLKKKFCFQYTMNELLILLSILAGIATFGFWGLVLGPTLIALAIASANLYRDYLGEEEHTPNIC